MVALPVWLFLLAFQAHSISFYNMVELPIKSGAACLDGSQAAFYIWRPDDDEPQPNKVLIYFQETPFGWCVKQDLSTSTEECYKFIAEENLNDFGSSSSWDESMTFLGGMLSQFEGGEFANYTKVYVRSCDGGAYMGNREPISYKKAKLFFRGSVNTVETFKYLKDKGYLSNKEDVVIAGSYNGALAAMQWAPTLQTFTSTRVRLLLDAGLYFNLPNHKTNQSAIENRMMMLNKLVLNGEGGPNSACTEANKENPWKCFFIGELRKFSNVQTFYMQSLYDGRIIDDILGFKCAVEFGSLSECQKWEREVIQQYHQDLRGLIVEASQGSGCGAFGISCVAHEMIGGKWQYEDYEVPMNSGKMASVVVSQWLKSKQSTVQIDEVRWPENKPCSRKLQQTEQ